MTHYQGSVPELEAAPSWHHDAACASPDHKNKDLWFPRQGDRKAVHEAKRICWGCPVRQQCLEWAFANREDRGIWAGLTEGERRALHKRARSKTKGGAGVRNRKAAA